MWKVYEAKTVTKDLKKTPKQIQQKYKAWVEAIKNGGSTNLRNFPGFKDEKLKGDLKDYYSIRINKRWRIVFKWVNSDTYEVSIVDYH